MLSRIYSHQCRWLIGAFFVILDFITIFLSYILELACFIILKYKLFLYCWVMSACYFRFILLINLDTIHLFYSLHLPRTNYTLIFILSLISSLLVLFFFSPRLLCFLVFFFNSSNNILVIIFLWLQSACCWLCVLGQNHDSLVI